jgi:hypothetical protein
MHDGIGSPVAEWQRGNADEQHYEERPDLANTNESGHVSAV